MATKSQSVRTKDSPYGVVTLKSVPARAPRTRGNYGWAALTKAGMALRIPTDEVKKARASLFAHQSRLHAEYAERKAAADAKAEPFNEKVPMFQTIMANDPMGKPLCAKKGGSKYEWADHDSPDAVPNQVNAKGKEIAAFYEFVRVQ